MLVRTTSRLTLGAIAVFIAGTSIAFAWSLPTLAPTGAEVSVPITKATGADDGTFVQQVLHGRLLLSGTVTAVRGVFLDSVSATNLATSSEMRATCFGDTQGANCLKYGQKGAQGAAGTSAFAQGAIVAFPSGTTCSTIDNGAWIDAGPGQIDTGTVPGPSPTYVGFNCRSNGYVSAGKCIASDPNYACGSGAETGNPTPPAWIYFTTDISGKPVPQASTWRCNYETNYGGSCVYSGYPNCPAVGTGGTPFTCSNGTTPYLYSAPTGKYQCPKDSNPYSCTYQKNSDKKTCRGQNDTTTSSCDLYMSAWPCSPTVVSCPAEVTPAVYKCPDAPTSVAVSYCRKK